MKPIGVRCLEYLTRFGLDESVLKDYKKCGALNYSARIRGADVAVVNKFLDTDDFISQELIEFVKEIEYKFNVNVYHILYNGVDTQLGKEFALMLTHNELGDNDESQLNELKCGKAYVIKLYPEHHIALSSRMNYSVRMGSVIDVNFKDSFKKSKIKYPNGRKYKDEN